MDEETGKQIREAIEGTQQWHQNRYNMLKGLSEHKDDHLTIKGPEEDDPGIKLTGDKLKGFKLGMMVAAESIKDFPLEIVNTEEDDKEE